MDFMNEDYEKMVKNAFAKNLKDFMAHYKIQNVDLSNRLDVSVQTVSAWTNGHKMPRMKMLDKLCTVLHCNRSDLLDPHGFTEMIGRETMEAHEKQSEAYMEYISTLPKEHEDVRSMRWEIANSTVRSSIDDLYLEELESLAEFAEFLLWKQEKRKER